MARPPSFVVLLLVLAEPLIAQDVPTITLRGVVKGSQTFTPLPNVNVFLANTAKGAATNAKGEFIIPNVPAGVYDVVVSMVGYERAIQRLKVFGIQHEPMQILLKETTYEIPQVDVVAKDDADWRNQLKKFRDYFFGETKNSSQCRILNPEDLDFTVDPQTGRFEATARKPLQIENPALGYKLEFVLQVFVIDGRTFKYGGVTHFQELKPETANRQIQWEQERVRAYRGSLRHFLSALARNKLEQEGFGISLMYRIPSSRTLLVPRETVTRDDILFLGGFPFERRLAFRDYLRVEYTKEAPEAEFSDFWGRQSQYQDPMGDQYQVSWLMLEFEDVRLNLNGILYDPFNLRTYGYWSYERIGEWLPLEYLPSSP